MKEYWTDETEEALAKYVTSKDIVEKNKIFDDDLCQPFKELIDAVLKRYGFPNVDNDIKLDVLAFLVLSVYRFKPNLVLPSGKKATGRAYCITLIRSWMADWRMKTHRQNQNIPFEECHEIHLKKIQ